MNIYFALLIGLIIGILLRHAVPFFRTRIFPGDIVLYVNPSSPPEERNLVTLVLDVFPEHGTALIRAVKTTMVVSQKNLQILRPDRAFPLQVPEKPQAEVLLPIGHTTMPLRYATLFEGEPLPQGARGICSPGNQASFTPIRLQWLAYGVGLDEQGKLCTTL